ncbi:MAG: hypothetical protein JW703_02720 [Candidatus Diapherotrites archaeon]|nr:hypothetical protein [Candidatus Diapherotrites archaeon]
MRESTNAWIKLIVFVATIAFVLWFILQLTLWAEPLKDYFSFMGDWETYILLFVLVLVVKFIFEKLLKWEAHAFFRRRK